MAEETTGELILPDTTDVRKAHATWDAAPLALLTDDEFEERVRLAALVRTRIRQIQRELLKENSKKRVIKGIDKPICLKEDAELLNKMARLIPTYRAERVLGDGDESPAVTYLVTCRLHAQDSEGPMVTEGVGSCNSHERKYRYRHAGLVCPECGTENVIKGKEEFGGGWLCFSKKGGCGAKWVDGDPAIEQQTRGQVVNEDPFDLDNTILKMAKKRAFVDATLTAHAASGLFTQDLDETVPDESVKKDPVKGTPPSSPSPAPSPGPPPSPSPETGRPPEEPETPPQQNGGSQRGRGDLTITAPQAKRFWAILFKGAKNKAERDSRVNTITELIKQYGYDEGIEAVSELILTRPDYNMICETLENRVW